MSFCETNNSVIVDNPCRLCMEDLIEYYAIDFTIQNVVAELLSIQITIEVKFDCFFICLFVYSSKCIDVFIFRVMRKQTQFILQKYVQGVLKS